MLIDAGAAIQSVVSRIGSQPHNVMADRSCRTPGTGSDTQSRMPFRSDAIGTFTPCPSRLPGVVLPPSHGTVSRGNVGAVDQNHPSSNGRLQRQPGQATGPSAQRNDSPVDTRHGGMRHAKHVRDSRPTRVLSSQNHSRNDLLANSQLNRSSQHPPPETLCPIRETSSINYSEFTPTVESYRIRFSFRKIGSIGNFYLLI